MRKLGECRKGRWRHPAADARIFAAACHGIEARGPVAASESRMGEGAARAHDAKLLELADAAAARCPVSQLRLAARRRSEDGTRAPWAPGVSATANRRHRVACVSCARREGRAPSEWPAFAFASRTARRQHVETDDCSVRCRGPFVRRHCPGANAGVEDNRGPPADEGRLRSGEERCRRPVQDRPGSVRVA